MARFWYSVKACHAKAAVPAGEFQSGEKAKGTLKREL
jgi:hypothetical protein